MNYNEFDKEALIIPEEYLAMSQAVKLAKELYLHGETVATFVAKALVAYSQESAELSSRISRLQEIGCNMTEEEEALDRLEDLIRDLLGFLDIIQ